MSEFNRSPLNYRLIYNADDNCMPQAAACRLAEYLSAQTKLQMTAKAKRSKASNVILVGKASRDVMQAGMECIHSNDEYCFGRIKDTFVIDSADRLGIVVACLKLIPILNCRTDAVNYETGLTYGKLSELPKDEFYISAVELAKKVYGTYGSRVEKMLADHKNEEDIKDQQLIKALICRMGRSFAISIGSSNVLYRGFVQKLDSEDYSKVTMLSEQGHLWIPTEFACQYFSMELEANPEGYVDLTEFCHGSEEYTLYFDRDREIAVVTPADSISFQESDVVSNGYSNAVFLDRMYAFFHNPLLPEPSTNTEKTRSVVAESVMEPQYVYDCSKVFWETHYSPAICTFPRGDGEYDIYAAYEYRQIQNFKGYDLPTTYLKRSTDGGKTWEQVCSIYMLCNVSLFVLKGKLYMLGFRNGKGYVMLGIYDPDTGTHEIAELDFNAGLRAPGTVEISNGRLYCAFNDTVISIDVDDDLTDSSCWTRSNNPQELLTRADFERITGKKTGEKNIFWIEEGNVVRGADGELYVLYRLDAAPTYGYAAIFHLSSDGKELSIVRTCGSVIQFPYTQSKFSVRYDKTTQKYISLTSLATADTMVQRNVLGLVASDDLIHWEVVDPLLVDREMINNTVSRYAHAFQYVDFVCAENDLLYLVREAIGNTFWFHDGNYITMYRLTNYVELIEKKLMEKKEEETP